MRAAAFKENAKKQRVKIRTMKENQGMVENDLDKEIEKELNKGESLPAASVKSHKLTE